MRDDRTPHRNYPLPSMEHMQEEDVPRLRAALGAIDGDVEGMELALSNLEGLPDGGTEGQVLTKKSTLDGDAEGKSPPLSDAPWTGATYGRCDGMWKMLTTPDLVVDSLTGGETDKAPSVAAVVAMLGDIEAAIDFINGGEGPAP